VIVLAVDPGTTSSAWVVYDSTSRAVEGRWFGENEAVLDCFRATRPGWVDVAVIEKVESYGMAVGAEVFETVWWSGRFAEALHPLPVGRLPRRAVKLHLCGSARAKDANVRQALLDRFGGSEAVGRKADPGPLYGVHGDLWAALAVAVTWVETR
jgi:hypothetical protein